MDFGPHAAIEFRQALDNGRPVLLVGPQRGGLTFWARSALQSVYEEFSVIDLKDASGRDVAQLVGSLNLGGAENGRDPDLSRLFATHFVRSSQRPLLFANCHRAEPGVLLSLLKAVSDPPPGVQIGGPMVLEGAIDFDAICASAFPNGLPQHPFVLYSQPPTPWGRVSEVEEIIRLRKPAIPASVVPLLCDVVGADLGLLGDVLDALPGATTRIETRAIARALQRATLGASAADITRSLPPPASPEARLLTSLVAGRMMPGSAPDVLEPGPTKKLYLSGLAFFDHAVAAYRISGPLAARIVARTFNCPCVSEASFVQSRAAYLLSITAGVELDIRALVAEYPRDAYEHVKAHVPTATVLKKIRAAIAGKGLAPECASVMFAVLGDTVHTEQSVLEAAAGRSKGVGEELEWLTFNELISVAQAVEVLPAALRATADRLVGRRNDVAHLRSVSSDQMDDVKDDALDIIQGLRRPDTS